MRLPRIVKDGEVSFEELVGLLISFVLDPENPTQNLEVKVTYVDNENDTIVVSSSEELMDAIDQSDDPKLLRLTAEVKRCAAKKGGSTAKPVPPPSNRASPEPTKTTTPTNNSSTNNAGTQAGPAPVLQHVVESVVDIILRAAVAVNGHGISSSPNNSHPFYSPDGTPTNTNNATAAAASSMEAPAPFAEHNQDQTSVAERTDVLPEAPIPAPDAAATEDVQPQPRVPEEKAAAKQENPKEEEKEELRPFIHGRHTCDSCLTTPIVGKRYHATNLPVSWIFCISLVGLTTRPFHCI